MTFALRKKIAILAALACLSLGAVLCAIPARAQQPLIAETHTPQLELPNAPIPHSLTPQQQEQQQFGTISGRVVDQSGANIPGVLVKLLLPGQAAAEQTFSNGDGLFSFTGVPPGPFQLTITSVGLAPQDFSGTLAPGQAFVTPLIMLNVATQLTEVHVALTPDELAQEQVNEQFHQRVFGFIPNFYVSYEPNAAPLPAKYKFKLAWKSAIDPVTFVAVGAVAGFDQAGDRWGAYGQGAEGYAKRFGATYADVFVGTFIGGAVLPSILKQDPRYFYKGTGTKRSRILYALANSVICKGDNGRWQPNYSNIGGNLAAGAISNLYYPANDRSAASTIFANTLIRLGETAVANIFQELVIPKLTPNLPSRSRAQP